MKTLRNICFSLLIISFMTGCFDSRKSYRDIDLEQEFSLVTLKASDLLANIRYIPLETTDTALIANIKSIIATDDYFFVRDKHLYMFDKQGKFLHKISKHGQGPGEYTTLDDCGVDAQHVYLFDSPRSQILVYSFDNKYLKSIKIPQGITNVMKSPAGFICYQDPLIGRKYGEPVPELIFLDDTGQLNKVLHYRTVNMKSLSPFIYAPKFTAYENKIFYYPPLQDTIFSVDENGVIPEFIINRGQYAVNPEDVDGLAKQKDAVAKGIIIHGFAIYDNRLFLYYGNKNKPLMVMYNLSTKELKRIEKFENDFDNLSFALNYLTNIKDNRIINPIFASYFFDKEENKSKIPKSVTNLKEDDNPILRILDLK
ncbi:MAG: 6-bladed beta-propeller [Bacteroidales bacterium]|nr:6-bladed beta-propeller [Bacteroidales bacterium]